MLKLLVVVCSAVAAYSANAKTLEINTGLLSEEIMLSEPSQDGAYKLARSHFLPDYQAALTGRTSQSNGGGNTKTCASYGNYFSECPSGTVGVGKTQPAPGVTCYKACDCNMDLFTYHKGNCTSPKLIGGTSCKKLTSATVGAKATVSEVSMMAPSSAPSGTYYSDCGCGSDFTLSSCPYGALCDVCEGKYKQTGCKSGYNRQANGTCCLNGYANIPSCPNTAPTRECPTSECCRCLCLNNDASCTASNYPYSTPPTCARSADSCSTGCGSNLVTRYKVTEWTAGYSTDGKCTVTPCPEGQSTNKTCSTGYKLENTQYYSAGKVCKKCVQKSCSEGGYVENCSEDYKPTSSPISYGGKKCYIGCTLKTCTDYNSSYKTSIPTDYKCTSVTPRSGLTCYKGCTLKTCTDYNSSYKTTIPSGQTCTPVTPRSGLTCYKDCKSNATCATGGYLDKCPVGQYGKSYNYNGQSCVKGCINPHLVVKGYLNQGAARNGGNNTTIIPMKFEFEWWDVSEYTADQKASLAAFRDNHSFDITVPNMYFTYGNSYYIATQTDHLSASMNDNSARTEITLSNGCSSTQLGYTAFKCCYGDNFETWKQSNCIETSHKNVNQGTKFWDQDHEPSGSINVDGVDVEFQYYFAVRS